ncbi:hypothetical protein GGR56DRAFT_673221 [Xylariaceae sp. FL0804]|nr:hypothetical protein GGR56DRAFT_673221 [Xylariaceae sp. FL0804]
MAAAGWLLRGGQATTPPAQNTIVPPSELEDRQTRQDTRRNRDERAGDSSTTVSRSSARTVDISASDAEQQLFALLTAYDNSDEPTPDFNRRHVAYGIIIFFMVFSWLCVTLRLYTRVKLNSIGADDVCVLIFRISGTIGSIFICLAYDHGFGKHFLDLSLSDMMEVQKDFYVALLTWTFSTALMKICLLLQYLRLFKPGTRTRTGCWFLVILTCLWGTAFAFCALFPCFPIQGFWNVAIQSKCYGFGSKISREIAATYITHTSTNMILDLVVLAVPLPLYFYKATQLKQRLALGAMVALGLLPLTTRARAHHRVNILSIWRLQGVVQNQAATYPVLDPTWYGPKSIILAVMEVDLASVVASVPIFWPLFEAQLGKIFVTQEVLVVTTSRRRLSSTDDDGGGRRRRDHLRRADSGLCSPDGSDENPLRPRRTGGSVSSCGGISTADGGSKESFEMMIMRNDDDDNKDSTKAKAASSSAASTAPSRHYKDAYVASTVVPLGVGCGDYDRTAKTGGVTWQSEVVSEGQRGFEREQRERFAAAAARKTSDAAAAEAAEAAPSGGAEAEARWRRLRDHSRSRSRSMSLTRKMSFR